MATERILVVEDDHDFRESLFAVLQELQYEIVLAATLDDALVQLRRQDFSLVLSEGPSPGPPNKWAPFETLVRDAAPAPVLLLTGHKIHPDEARRHGLAGSLYKPFDVGELLQVIGPHLRASLSEGDHEIVRM